MLALAALAAAPVGAQAATAEEELAERYAPVVRLAQQPEPCGPGEPHEPTDVRAVLGNDEVVLHGPGDDNDVVRVAPTERDLAAGRAGAHLDYPGDARSPGCTYEQWEQRLRGAHPPTTYARVAADPDHPDRIALQYWLFYVFNDANSTHEDDWELIQLVFPAASAEAALAVPPSRVGYSQHADAEQAVWGDAKLALVDGTHPVVRVATGSHANYFGAQRYLRRSAEGLSCDVTVGPTRDVLPTVALLPTDPAAAVAAYPWLAFRGRWGERQPGFHDGPTGPNEKPQWAHPIAWADDAWRDASFALPGAVATDGVCEVVGSGSELLTRAVREPAWALAILAGLAALLLWAGLRTSWSQTAPLRISRRRAGGEIVLASARLYRRHPRLFLGSGLVFVPLGVLAAAGHALLFERTSLGALLDVAGNGNAAILAIVLALDVGLGAVGLLVVQAAVAQAMVQVDEERRPSVREAYRATWQPVRPLLGALWRIALVVALLSATVVGLPVAVWLLGRWLLTVPAVVFERRSGRDAMRRSAELVAGRWWRTAALLFVVGTLALLPVPVLGLLVLGLTGSSVVVADLVAAAVCAVTAPYVAIAVTYLFLDLRLHAREAPVAPTDVLAAEA